MSKRDQEFVESLGISVARIAGAMNKSRQTVNRGVHSENQYFKLPELAKALENWRDADPPLYSIAKHKICAIYPEFADTLLDSIAQADSAPRFSTSLPGEYWLVCGDLAAFKTELPSCARQLEALSENPEAQIVLFVTRIDLSLAKKLAVRHRRNSVTVIPCHHLALRLVPTTLFRTDPEGIASLYGVSDGGFIGLSRFEATRLRSVLKEMLFNVQRNAGTIDVPEDKLQRA